MESFETLIDKYRCITGETRAECLALTYRAIIDSGDADPITLLKIRLLVNEAAAREIAYQGFSITAKVFDDTGLLVDGNRNPARQDRGFAA